jgi:hypothetical protein
VLWRRSFDHGAVGDHAGEQLQRAECSGVRRAE